MIILVFALFVYAVLPVAADPAQYAPPDDEIVLLDAQGHIQVVDPYTPSFLQPVHFTSTSKGWKSIALGDVNGDGDQEIVALRNDQIRIFDPVVQPGSTRVRWYALSPEGDWTSVAVGDLDGDGQAEIVAAHTSARTPTVAQVMVFDPNEDASSFRVVFTRDLDIPVMKLATGDVDGDGWDDVVVMGSTRALLYVFQGGMWDTLVYTVEPKPWVDVVVAQTHADSASKEIALLRAVPESMDSYVLYRWLGGGNLFVLDKMAFFPNMSDVDAFDMNGDGDDELLFVRPDDSQVPIVVRNPAGYVLPRNIAIWGGPGWERVAGGDFDGDGWGEIAVLKEHAYRIYTEPEVSDAFVQTAGDFRLALAVGNLDGPGIPVKPVLRVSANHVTFHYESYTPVPAQAVTITNAGGGGALAWTASVTQGEDWLTITPTSGVTPDTLAIAVHPEHLPTGTYEGSIQVRAPGALESPQIITVTLTVVTPVLEVQPRNVAFDAQKGHPPINQRVVVNNTGVGGSIGWHAQVVQGKDWLQIAPDAGTTPTELAAIIDPTAMDVGLYVGAIQVEADDPVVNNSPITVTVVATIRPPIMQVTPDFIYVNVRQDEVYTPPRIDIVQYGVPEGHAIHWVAGVIPSSQSPTRAGTIDASRIESVTPSGVVFREGEKRIYVPSLDWVHLDPWYGVTPGVAFVHIDNQTMAPGVYYATIVIDGGKGTENRFQGVDLKVVIPRRRQYVPIVTTYPYPW